MEITQLVRMANQIAQFFSAMPDRNQAVDDVASHLRRFWEPRMRRELLAFLEQYPDGQGSTAQLDAMVLEAVERHRAELTPAT